MDNGEGSEVTDVESALRGRRHSLVYMWGYLPGALPQRTPLLTPVTVRFPANSFSWKDVCGGGCGFAMAISGALSFSQFLCYFIYLFILLLILDFRISVVTRHCYISKLGWI